MYGSEWFKIYDIAATADQPPHGDDFLSVSDYCFGTWDLSRKYVNVARLGS